MGSMECRVDQAKNRLYISLKGFFRGRDAEPAHRDLENALERLLPGFDVITDLSGFIPGSPDASEALKKGGELVKTKGRRNAVRVTGGLITGLMQFRRLLGGVFDEDSVRYATSLEEADAILDEWAKETVGD